MTPKAKLLSLCIVPVLLFIIMARVAHERRKAAVNQVVIVNQSGQTIKQLRFRVTSYTHYPAVLGAPALYTFTNIPPRGQVIIQYTNPLGADRTRYSIRRQFQNGRLTGAEADLFFAGARRHRQRTGCRFKLIIPAGNFGYGDLVPLN